MPEQQGPERESPWESALKDESLADTPAKIRLLAAAAKQAMLETADRHTPSDQATQHAWQALEREAEARGLFDERYSWLEWFLAPRRLAFAMVLALAAGTGIIWHEAQQSDSGITIVAMRGDATVLTVSDADAETPELVRELRALKLSPELSRTEDGTRIDVAWPVPPSPQASAWLTEKGFHLSADGKLHLYLVKPTP